MITKHIGKNTLFQFHNGTINTLKELVEIFSCYKFQFHNGTINTKNKRYCSTKKNGFQFHNGTINTLRHKYNMVFSLCFNSTTVQLIRSIRS